MSSEMFCFQCEEVLKGVSCISAGTCGKRAPLSARMDLLIFMIKGLCVVADTIRRQGGLVDPRTDRIVVESLFSTMTNVNFDDLDIERRCVNAMELRYEMMQQAHIDGISLPDTDEVNWFGLPIDFAEKARTVGILHEPDMEVRGYKEFIVYGLKGMCAYLYHAMNVGTDDSGIHHFIQKAMCRVTLGLGSSEEWYTLLLEVGRWGLKAMALLDKAYTSRLGIPRQSEVSARTRRRPGILVSGHDMGDLLQLLEQCERSGVDVYTHGEMLPAHHYPELRRFHCLAGNYGNSWWEQHHEFDAFHGPILMTSDCLVPLYIREGYQNRLYTTGPVSYPGARHIKEDASGLKDFSRLIEQAKKYAAPEDLGGVAMVGGFSHLQLARRLDKIVRLLKEDKIRQIVVIAGCDGRMAYRQYYTDLARRLPHDTLILTCGCVKYRFIRNGFGHIESLPRVLDLGQCNDFYSLFVFVRMLREALGLSDVNDLPIVYNVAWYEQKSVVILLAMLHLGIRNIRLGPTLPPFITESMYELLQRDFGLQTIGTVEEDIRRYEFSLTEA